MNLLETIDSHLKDAIKAGDTNKAGTLKMVKSDLMYEKAKTGEDLTDEKMLEVVSRAAKRRKESILEYRKGEREDLAAQEESELVIIQEYLPEQMSEADVEAFISAKLAEMGEVSQKDFGRVMGSMMKELKGKVDGGVVKKVLTAKLG
ncbi:MAG: GatB/YqeY domain-containing protein [bacterium]|nr:GatB/YqeY domain-containing protein [bacterium]